MDESTYEKLVARTFRQIEDAFAEVDPDQVEVAATGDVLTLAFARGVRCVVNTQRAVRQLWMAARDRAWHFSYDARAERWIDDRDLALELFAVLRDVARKEGNIDLVAPRAD